MHTYLMAAVVGMVGLIGGSMAFGEDFVVIDKAEFEKIIPPQAKVETLAGDFGFIEGPVWFNTDKGGYLLFSDLPHGVLRRCLAARGDARRPRE